jgi:hypothetical protein
MEADRGAFVAWSAGVGVTAAVAGGRANGVNTSAFRSAGERVEIAYQHDGHPSEPTIMLAPQP